MIDVVAELRLKNAWRECERHCYHLFHALSIAQTFRPMTATTYLHLTDEQIQSLDQFVLRFTKLQDTIGSRLFPAILQCLQEPLEGRPMLDKLNRLEKLGFIESAEQWQMLRTIRNQFSHDYPDDPERNAAQFNMAFKAAESLYLMLQRIYSKFSAEYPLLELGRPLSGAVFDYGVIGDGEE